MNNQDLNGESIWSRTTEIPPRRPLPGDVTADAAVIGAGMAGMLTAFLLSRQGISVIVLEADRIAGGQTKNTTAKITSQHGLFYQKLIRTAGKERARLYASAGESAVEAFETLIREEQISCHFKRLPSYLYSRDPARQADLERETRAASALGIRACFTGQTGLPFETVGAVRFDNQAQFHPLEFIKALADQVTVYEKTRVIRVKGHTVYTNRGTVTARHIIFATHYPFVNVPGFFFTRLHQDRSYCLGLSGAAPLDGMYYSVDRNGLSLRWNEDTLLLGGGSHRTGKNRAGGEYERLAKAAKQLYPDCRHHSPLVRPGLYEPRRYPVYRKLLRIPSLLARCHRIQEMGHDLIHAVGHDHKGPDLRPSKPIRRTVSPPALSAQGFRQKSGRRSAGKHGGPGKRSVPPAPSVPAASKGTRRDCANRL